MQDTDRSITQLSPKLLEDAIADCLQRNEISAGYKAFISNFTLRQDSRGACSAEIVISISEPNNPASVTSPQSSGW